MALHGRKLMLINIIQLSFLILAASALEQLPKPNCSTSCGNLKNIPYPFGIGDGCYLPQRHKEFSITCKNSDHHATALLRDSNMEITNISLHDGELQILQDVARDCYNEQGVLTKNTTSSFKSPFIISDTKNIFMGVGCDTHAVLEGYRSAEEMYVTGCLSYCERLDGVVNESSCSGIGCCQTFIPSSMNNQTVGVRSFINHMKGIWKFNPCSYAFVVQKDYFNFSSNSLKQLDIIKKLPMILDWKIGDYSTCDEAKKGKDYACKENSECVKPPNRNGYICKCLQGYQGNPYLSNSCHDIDECHMNHTNPPCHAGSTCHNEPGTYSCICDKGYKKDASNGTTSGCIKDDNKIPLIISLGVLGSFFVLLIVIFWIYCGMKRRKFMRLKDTYFKQNGGLYLKQHLASYKGTVATKARIFTAEELKKATDNYNEKIGEGAYGAVYKGTLSDGTDVAIKKSKVNAPPAQSNQFVNELIVLSEINHRNVVRLLGCCLETPSPILIYEYVNNGTLYDHIHKKEGKDGPRPPLSLEKRLNIVAGTADALAYLHYSTTLQIIHRDVKATNILLDKDFTAKVSDFGASRLVPEDQDQLSTLVQGTLGYLDPEYLQSNTLTEKSDVYSFGVVLAEVLTSTQALSFKKPEAERNLANFFVCSVEEGRLDQILDAEIIKEGKSELVQKLADLTKRCLRLKGRERPSMKVVSLELERLIDDMEKQHAEKADYKRSPKETDHLLGSPNFNSYSVDVKGGEVDAGGSSSTPTDTLKYDRSMQTQAQTLQPNDAGR